MSARRRLPRGASQERESGLLERTAKAASACAASGTASGTGAAPGTGDGGKSDAPVVARRRIVEAALHEPPGSLTSSSFRSGLGSMGDAASFSKWGRPTPAGLSGLPFSPSGPSAPTSRMAGGMARSKSVTERLDARFKRAALFQRAPAGDDRDWPLDDVLRSLARRRQRPSGGIRLLRFWGLALMRDPWLRAAVVVVGGGGAAAFGAAGGICGFVAGASAGAVVGTVPAFLTFGLSIPAGAAAGGALGSGIGALAAGSFGLVTCGALGGTVYEHWAELRGSASRARDSLLGCAAYLGSHALAIVGRSQATASGALFRVRDASREAAVSAGLSAVGKASELASDQKVQIAAVSAAGASVALGTTGGAMGVLIGSATGAAWGVIPALLTFGLSIPVCATVVGAAGLVTGTTAGGAVGLVGGGAVGYGAAALAGEDLRSRVQYVRGKASAALGRQPGTDVGSGAAIATVVGAGLVGGILTEAAAAEVAGASSGESSSQLGDGADSGDGRSRPGADEGTDEDDGDSAAGGVGTLGSRRVRSGCGSSEPGGTGGTA